jgi:hypothetical protein
MESFESKIGNALRVLNPTGKSLDQLPAAAPSPKRQAASMTPAADPAEADAPSPPPAPSGEDG